MSRLVVSMFSGQAGKIRLKQQMTRPDSSAINAKSVLCVKQAIVASLMQRQFFSGRWQLPGAGPQPDVHGLFLPTVAPRRDLNNRPSFVLGLINENIYKEAPQLFISNGINCRKQTVVIGRRTTED